MGGDQRRPDRRPLLQAEITRRRWRKAGAERRAGRDDLVSDFCVIVGCEIAKTDALEIAVAPALFVSEEIPFTSQRAYRAQRRSGVAKRQILGESEAITGPSITRRQMPLQPKQFWNLHFGGDRAADVAQHVVMGVINFTGFGDRAMVHPDDD